jgi:hypothetical protein
MVEVTDLPVRKLGKEQEFLRKNLLLTTLSAPKELHFSNSEDRTPRQLRRRHTLASRLLGIELPLNGGATRKAD